MRNLTVLEAAIGVALAGAAVAALVPAFARNLHASRLTEALEGLETLAARATSLAAGRAAERAYPGSAPLTPAQVPRGAPVVDSEGTWTHPTWVRLGFSTTAPHWYSFEFESGNAEGVARFTASAHGDLDGDGLRSTFEVSGESRDGAEPTVYPLEVHRAVE